MNPYQSPQTTSDPVNINLGGPTGGQRVIPFASGHTRAVWTMSLLAIGMFMDLVGAGSGYLEVGLLTRAQAGIPYTDAEADSNDTRQIMVGFAQMAVFLATAIAFLMWFHRAHRNLPSLGCRNLKYSPGWAVGAWFVPILNLFRPFQIMGEIWRGSDSTALAFDSPNPRVRSASPLVGWWWGLWIAKGIVGQAAFRISLRAETLGALLASSWVSVVGDLISLPAALLAIAVVRGVDASQEERHRLLTRGSESQTGTFGDAAYS